MSRRSTDTRCPRCGYAYHEGGCFVSDGSDSWMDGYDAGRLAAIRADVEREVADFDRGAGQFAHAPDAEFRARIGRAYEVRDLRRWLRATVCP